MSTAIVTIPIRTTPILRIGHLPPCAYSTTRRHDVGLCHNARHAPKRVGTAYGWRSVMCLRPFLRTTFIILATLIAGSRLAEAQTGIIAGVVKDTTGAVLPGVTIEAASPALIEKV